MDNNFDTAAKSYAEVASIAKVMRAEGVPDFVVSSTRLRMVQRVRMRYMRQERLRASVTIADQARAELDRLAERVKQVYPFVVDLTSPRRRADIVSARRVFIRAARTGTHATYPELAVYMRRAGKHTGLIFLYQTAAPEEVAIAERIAKAVVRDRKLELRKRRAT